MTPCKIPDCEKPAKSFGMCNGHYTRWRLGKPVDATPLGRCYKGIPVEERF